MFLINVERNLAEESNLGNDNSSLNELLSLLLYCIFCALLLFSILFCILHPLVLLLLFDCFLLICFVHLIRIDLVFVEFIGVRSTFAIFEENTRSGKSLYDATMLEMEDETQSFGVDEINVVVLCRRSHRLLISMFFVLTLVLDFVLPFHSEKPIVKAFNTTHN